MLKSLKVLLSSIVDYAGLFPPAQLSLSDARVMYHRAQGSPHCWMLDRFVIPASRLPELVEQLSCVSRSSESSSPWPLSVILSKDWMAELQTIQSLMDGVSREGNFLHVSTLEVAPLPLSDIQQIGLHHEAELPLFVEIPWEAELEPYLDVLHETGMAAKLRTGGITPEAFPCSSKLSQRLLSLAEARIPFKATAGLHYPLRSSHVLTDAPQPVSAVMHGFLNVAILAAFAYQKPMTLDEAVMLLEESSLEAFHWTDDGLEWDGSHRNGSHYNSSHNTGMASRRVLSIAEIEQARQQFFRSFGSCSFQEPVHDLQGLGLL